MSVDLARRLLATGLLQREDVQRLLLAHVLQGTPLLKVLLDRGLVPARAIDDEYARAEIRVLRRVYVHPDLVSRLPFGLCLRLWALPLRRDAQSGRIDVAALDPFDRNVVSEMSFHFDAPIRVFRGPPTAMAEALRLLSANEGSRPPRRLPARLTPPYAEPPPGGVAPGLPRWSSLSSAPPIPLVRPRFTGGEGPKFPPPPAVPSWGTPSAERGSGAVPPERASGAGHAERGAGASPAERGVSASQAERGAGLGDPEGASEGGQAERGDRRSFEPSFDTVHAERGVSEQADWIVGASFSEGLPSPPPLDTFTPLTPERAPEPPPAAASRGSRGQEFPPRGPLGPFADLGSSLSGMRQARSRDDVVEHLLTGLGTAARRVGIFAVRQGEFRGWRCNHAFGDARGFRGVVISSAVPSVFATAAAVGHYLGPLPRTASHEALLGVMGGAAGEVAVMPVVVGGRAVLFLLLDEIGDTMLATRRAEDLSRTAGEVLGRLVRRDKAGEGG
ncbi:MAG: hypothetical protein MUF34_05765 [Polyangiaceae bacterium]|nr:hypothetical protein [Polyangiaceae bacterium]